MQIEKNVSFSDLFYGLVNELALLPNIHLAIGLDENI